MSAERRGHSIIKIRLKSIYIYNTINNTILKSIRNNHRLLKHVAAVAAAPIGNWIFTFLFNAISHLYRYCIRYEIFQETMAKVTPCGSALLYRKKQSFSKLAVANANVRRLCVFLFVPREHQYRNRNTAQAMLLWKINAISMGIVVVVVFRSPSQFHLTI